MKVYLSPSQQESNIGVGAYGSEAKRCQDIADRVRKLLVAAGVTVNQTPRSWQPLGGTEWLAKVVARSNAFRPDVHVCIHTNASSTKTTHGTDAWHYPGSAKGRALADAIYKRVVKVSGKGNGVHTSPVFYETAHADAPVAYLELVFHTNKADCLSVIDRPGAYARAIAEGIAECGGVKLPTTKPKPKPIELTDKNISLPRMYKPRAGWWNFQFRAWIARVRLQGDGDRIKTAGDPLIIPVPVVRPKFWKQLMEWKKRQRAAELATIKPPTTPAPRKRSPYFWRYKR